MKSPILFAAVIAIMLVSATTLSAQDVNKMNNPRPRTEVKNIDEKKRNALCRYLKKQSELRRAISADSSSVDSCGRKPTENICDGKDRATSNADSTTCKSRNIKQQKEAWKE